MDFNPLIPIRGTSLIATLLIPIVNIHGIIGPITGALESVSCDADFSSPHDPGADGLKSIATKWIELWLSTPA